MVTTRTSTPPSVGEPTTSLPEPTTESGLRARLWIGRNPMPFVLACLVIGLWVGTASVRSSRGGES